MPQPSSAPTLQGKPTKGFDVTEVGHHWRFRCTTEGCNREFWIVWSDAAKPSEWQDLMTHRDEHEASRAFELSVRGRR